MAANASKAQVAKRYRDAGIMQPGSKLDGEELRAQLQQRSVKFAHKNTKRAKTRSSKRAAAIHDW